MNKTERTLKITAQQEDLLAEIEALDELIEEYESEIEDAEENDAEPESATIYRDLEVAKEDRDDFINELPERLRPAA